MGHSLHLLMGRVYRPGPVPPKPIFMNPQIFEALYKSPPVRGMKGGVLPNVIFVHL